TTTAAVPVTKPPDNVSVVGVRIFGKDREAFVSDGTQGQAITRRVRTGDQIAGYIVKAIERTAVTLTSPSGDVVSMPLTLDAGKAQPSGPRQATPVRQPIPRRPPQPAAAQLGSPAAGVQGPSPPAGLAGRPPPPAAAQPAATDEPAGEAPLGEEEAMVLNFERADIREVIHSLATALGISYTIDPRIEGQVTIRTAGKIAREDLWPLLNQILRNNGIA